MLSVPPVATLSKPLFSAGPVEPSNTRRPPRATSNVPVLTHSACSRLTMSAPFRAAVPLLWKLPALSKVLFASSRKLPRFRMAPWRAGRGRSESS